MNIREFVAGTPLHHFILLAFFLIAFLFQLGMYILVYNRLIRFRRKKGRPFRGEVSVIICAKNEAENLGRFLPLVLRQDYPQFEVVVVNDSSTDDTEQILMELASEHSHLRYTSIPEDEKLKRGKKLALTIGLKAARYDHILLTDADCYPVSDQWIKQMASHFSSRHRIVLGYGGYEKKKGLLNILIRYETTFTAMHYLSYAILGKPYMGVGRNLAYEKALFFENKGFATHYHLASGDDDLFVNANATSENCVVELSPESHTRSVPETSFRGWIRQKKRHLSAGSHYHTGSRIRLAVEWTSRIFLYITLVWNCVSSPWKIPVASLFTVLLIIRLSIFKMAMRRLKEEYLLLPSLLLDPVFPVILGILWISGRFDKKYQPWK